MFDKLFKNERGNVVMIFALALIPILAVAGSAIDISRMQSAKIQMASLLDQAVLASANLSYTDDPEVLIEDWMNFFSLSFSNKGHKVQYHQLGNVQIGQLEEVAVAGNSTSVPTILSVTETGFESVSFVEVDPVKDISSPYQAVTI